MGTAFDFSKSSASVDWDILRTETLLNSFTYKEVWDYEERSQPDPREFGRDYTSGSVYARSTVNEQSAFDPQNDFSLGGAFSFNKTITNFRETRWFEDDHSQPVWWGWTETIEWRPAGADQVQDFYNVLIGGVRFSVDINGTDYGNVSRTYVTYGDALGKPLSYFENDRQSFIGSAYADDFTLSAFSERITPGAGADVVAPGLGTDTIYIRDTLPNGTFAGESVDTIRYTSIDEISLVNPSNYSWDTVEGLGAGDRIDLSAIAGLTYIGKNEFSGRAGEYSFTASGLLFDMDGDRVSDRTLSLSVYGQNFYTDNPRLNESVVGSNILVVGAVSPDVTAPVIQSVSVPNSPMNIGDVVTATITVANDVESYSLISGLIGGFTLSSLTKASGTTYTALFTVTEGGDDVVAGGAIPVSLVLQDDAGNSNTAFTTAIVGSADGIDANRPGLLSGTVNESTIVLTFDETLAGTTPDTGRPTSDMFTVLVNGQSTGVQFTSVEAADRTVTLHLGSSVQPGDTVSVSYTEPFDPNGTQDNYAAIQDAAGNDAAAFSQFVVGNLGSAPPPVPSAGSDLNGDGRSDILFQHSGGQAAVWMMDASTISGGGAIGPNPGPSWHAVLAADFNSDSRSDILWQDEGGQAAVWTVDGTALTGATMVGPNAGPNWLIKEAADFTGDGQTDILFQDASGQAALWTLTGLNLVGGAAVGPNPGPTWHVKAAGDLDGDGKADIVWQDDSGSVAVWTMDGPAITGAGILGISPGPSWHVIDAADFTGDGKADILWQSDAGDVAIWTMNRSQITGASSLPSPGAAWHAREAGDFSGDGKPDIAFQHDSGAIAVWTMNGLQIAQAAVVDPSPGADWHMI